MYITAIAVAFVALILLGRKWSSDQRLKSVQEAYDNILEEVRRERRGESPETITIYSLKRF